MSRQSLTPGFRFKDGKLHIFTPNAVMLIRGWPDPSAVTKRQDRTTWRAFIPEFRLVHPYRSNAKPKKEQPEQPELFAPEELGPPRLSAAEQRKRAFDGFRFSLPKPVARALQDFQQDQWEPLFMLHAWGEPALDLFASNPVLAFWLAHFRRFRPGLPARKIPRDIVKTKQCDILNWLLLPGSNAAVKIVRKLRPESIAELNAEDIRRMLENSRAMKVLAHMPQINTGVLTLVGHRGLHQTITPALLEEVAVDRRQRYYPHTARLLERTLHIHRHLNPDHPRPKFRSLASLQAKHDALSEEYLRQAPERMRGMCFPRPPISGTAEIVPITRPDELIREGLTQANCVATYADRIVSRSIYIYRVLRPERATLSIKKTPRGSWMVDQLLLARNRPVSTQTRDMVTDWLLTQSTAL